MSKIVYKIINLFNNLAALCINSNKLQYSNIPKTLIFTSTLTYTDIQISLFYITKFELCGYGFNSFSFSVFNINIDILIIYLIWYHFLNYQTYFVFQYLQLAWTEAISTKLVHCPSSRPIRRRRMKHHLTRSRRVVRQQRLLRPNRHRQ